MKRTAALAVSVCILAGCHKHEEVTATPPPTPDTNAAAAGATAPSGPPAPAPLTEITPPKTPAATPDLNFLSMRVRDWIFANGRTPKNFEEFAASAHMQIPPPPPGKKYVISSRMRVMLVDR